MKSWVISLSRWSDGAHHSSPAPQISLYLSSTSIQQNNSPKSLSIFHTLPPPPPLCILFYFAIWKAEAYGLCLSVLCSSLYAIKTEGTDRMERGVKRRADNVYNRFIYLLSLASFSVSRIKLHTRRHGEL